MTMPIHTSPHRVISDRTAISIGLVIAIGAMAMSAGQLMQRVGGLEREVQELRSEVRQIRELLLSRTFPPQRQDKL